MGYVYIGGLVASFLFILVYVWPAIARLWGPFLIASTIASLVVISFWVSAVSGFNSTNPPQGLSRDAEIVSRWSATAYLLLACVSQWVRFRAISMSHAGYKHWRVVVLLAFVPPVVILPFVLPSGDV